MLFSNADIGGIDNLSHCVPHSLKQFLLATRIICIDKVRVRHASQLLLQVVLVQGKLLHTLGNEV